MLLLASLAAGRGVPVARIRRAAQLASDPMQSVGVRPELLKQVGIDQKLNQTIPLNLTFRDENGNTVAARTIFRAEAGDSHAGLLQLPDAVHAGAERRGIRPERTADGHRQAVRRGDHQH